MIMKRGGIAITESDGKHHGCRFAKPYWVAAAQAPRSHRPSSTAATASTSTPSTVSHGPASP